MTVEQAGGDVVGTSRFLSLRPEDRGLEIGYTLVSPRAWGGGANSEAKLLMLRLAFEQLGCARVEFKTDAINERVKLLTQNLPANPNQLRQRFKAAVLQSIVE